LFISDCNLYAAYTCGGLVENIGGSYSGSPRLDYDEEEDDENDDDDDDDEMNE
jgi:hypothetical protein